MNGTSDTGFGRPIGSKRLHRRRWRHRLVTVAGILAFAIPIRAFANCSAPVAVQVLGSGGPDSNDARASSGYLSRPPIPPFDDDTAVQKARLAEDAWNSRDPARVALAYTADSQWRNRAEFIAGRDAIEAFLARKWSRELDYRLIKEVWTHAGNRIAARFAYEYRDDSGHWFRAHGNENWQFDADGLMERRIASINEHPIDEVDRKFYWPLGRRPDSHPGLSELGL